MVRVERLHPYHDTCDYDHLSRNVTSNVSHCHEGGPAQRPAPASLVTSHQGQHYKYENLNIKDRLHITQTKLWQWDMSGLGSFFSIQLVSLLPLPAPAGQPVPVVGRGRAISANSGRYFSIIRHSLPAPSQTPSGKNCKLSPPASPAKQTVFSVTIAWHSVSWYTEKQIPENVHSEVDM